MNKVYKERFVLRIQIEKNPFFNFLPFLLTLKIKGYKVSAISKLHLKKYLKTYEVKCAIMARKKIFKNENYDKTF